MLQDCSHCHQFVWFDPGTASTGKACPGCGHWISITPDEPPQGSGQQVGPRPVYQSPEQRSSAAPASRACPLDPGDVQAGRAVPAGTPTSRQTQDRRRRVLQTVAIVLLLVFFAWIFTRILPGGGNGDTAQLGDLAGTPGSPSQYGQSPGSPESNHDDSLPAGDSSARAPRGLPGAGIHAEQGATNLPPEAATTHAPKSSGGEFVTAMQPVLPESAATGGRARPGGGVFTGGVGTRFVFVIDSSSSMGQAGRFEAVTDDLSRKLAVLTPRHFFYIVLFDTEAHPMPVDSYLAATPQNAGAMLQWLRNQQPGGSTDPSLAMQLALALNPHTIWLLSDGEFDTAQTAPRLIAAVRSRRIPVNTIAFHTPGDQTLRPIAMASGGSYLFIPPQGDRAPFPRPSRPAGGPFLPRL